MTKTDQERADGAYKAMKDKLAELAKSHPEAAAHWTPVLDQLSKGDK